MCMIMVIILKQLIYIIVLMVAHVQHMISDEHVVVYCVNVVNASYVCYCLLEDVFLVHVHSV